jgi:S-adenosylmethionine hydrolase
MPTLVTLTTDFGLADPYVGQVKGVILGLCPAAQIVDLTHFIPPQAVSRAALVVAASAEHFPDGTIHLAVVDPGVGTARRALVVQANGHLFVAPDNGLLTVVLRRNPEAKVRAVTNESLPRTKISPTFHGRDVFAPVVGHLANGLPPARWAPASTTRSASTCPRPS